jgi:hypothetical protein
MSRAVYIITNFLEFTPDIQGTRLMPRLPRCKNEIKGTLQISNERSGVFIGGDPDGLRSLARILNWLADIDQEAYQGIPIGERVHTHLSGKAPYAQLTQISTDTELCRLDAKGTGKFPT